MVGGNSPVHLNCFKYEIDQYEGFLFVLYIGAVCSSKCSLIISFVIIILEKLLQLHYWFNSSMCKFQIYISDSTSEYYGCTWRFNVLPCCLLSFQFSQHNAKACSSWFPRPPNRNILQRKRSLHNIYKVSKFHRKQGIT